MGNSNIYCDRKSTFERKNYFKKVENIYSKKYSNNKIVDLLLVALVLLLV